MLEIILAALLAAAVETVFTVVLLLFAAVIEWFLELAEAMDETDLAFTLKTEMEQGRYNIVQGVFDQSTDKVKQARRIQANRLEDRVKRAHDNRALVIYT